MSLNWIIHGWGAVRKDLVKSIKFDEQMMNGDELTTRKLFYNSKVVLFTDAQYFYRLNDESTTRSKKNRARQYEALTTDGNIYIGIQ